MIKIKKVTPFREPTKVYDIEVDQNHNYFANGLLVSNSHITLFESIPNPTFVGTRGKPGPVMLLTGLNHKEFENIINCKTQVNGKTGGEAIKDMLSKIDVKKELKETLEKLPKLRATELDRANRKAKHLLALDKAGIKPVDAYMMKHVPVIPPIFRPITALEDGSISPADINTLYLRLIQDSNKLKTMDKSIPDEEKNKLRAGLYDKLKSVVGLGSTPTYDQNKKLKGIMQTIAGESPKEGFFQDKLVKRRQELSMRSTITPAQDIGIDQVGLPKEAAMDLYKPFVVKELVTTGINQLEALRHIKDKTPLAWRALEKAAEKRPVLLKRDPVLHKYNIQAFFPKLVEGNSIKIHPLICSGTNADFDGDSTIGEVIIVTSENLWYNIDMPHSNQPILSSNIIDIKDFPRLDSTKIIKSNGVEEYDVPNGVFVPSLSNNEMNWAPVTKFSIHPNCEEWITRTRLGRELISSSDHSLATFDFETLEVVQTRPSESVSRCIPIFRGIQKTHLLEELPGEPSNRSINNQKNINKMIDKVPLNWDIGWFIGATIGDGWVIHWNNKSQGISLATGDNQVDLRNKWVEVSDFLCGAKQYSITQPHKFEGIDCSSTTTRIRSAQVGRWMERLIGSGAQNKHLPPNFLATPLEFRMGLFCGLIDTDGTCCWTNKPQFTLTYHTISKTLANEVILLCNSLGLIASITEYTNRDKPAYIITISIRCAQEATWIKFVRQDKMQAIIKLWNMDNVDYGRDDIVPLPPRVQTELLLLMKNLGASLRINKNKEAASQYTILLKRNPVITRQSVERLGKLIDGKEISPFLMKWFSIALNKNIGWDLILESKPSGEYKTMYDITVPDSWTFTMANGAVVWDTMAAYLPVTEEARREAIEKMLPSKNLFSSTHYGVMHTPDQEAVMGLYYLSRWGQKKDKQYKSSQDILNDKSLHINDVVQLNGKDTTLGRQLIVQKLPEEFKTEELQHDPNFKLKKRWLYGFLEKVAHKDGKAYPEIVNHFKDIGNKYAYEEGLTFGLKDLKPLKEAREKILKPYHEQAEQIWNNKALSKEEQERQVVKVYTEATNKLDEQLHPEFKKLNNMIYTTAIEVGGKGSKASFRQMNIAPMLLVDATNRIVPSPVTHSYSEGLNVAEYWTALHGARKGTLQKVEGTQEPGKITKEIVNLNINTLVTHPDCGTKEGIKLPVDEVDVVERYTSHPIHVNGRTIPANTHITPELVGELKKFGHKDIMVRSSLTCKDHDGICQRCLGHSSEGRPHEIGTNIGVTASQALGEPLIQMTLDSFHCNHYHSLVQVLINNTILTITLESLWNLVESNILKQDMLEIKETSNLYIWDGTWNKVYKITRHMPDSKIVSISNGQTMQISQDTHPVIVWENLVKCINCSYHRIKKSSENQLKGICPNCKKYQDMQPKNYSNISKKIEIKNLQAKKWYVKHSVCIPEDRQEIDIDGYLSGFFLSEGCIIYNKNNKPNRITFSQNNGEIKDYVLSIIPENWRPKKSLKAIICNNAELARSFSSYFPRYSRNKSLPANFLSYSNEWLADFIAGVCDGDATIKHHPDGPSQINIDTTSFILAQQIYFICMKLGIVCNIIQTPIRKLTRYQGFKVNLRMTEKAKKLLSRSIKVRKLPIHSSPEQEMNLTDFSIITNIKDVLYPENTYVYDVTTESGQFTCSGILVSNSGGTAASRGGASVSRVERVNQLLNMPKTIPGSATLSEVDGVISKIEKDEATNGHHIWVGDKKHFVPQGAYMMEHIKPGHKIEKGEAFNYGPINPHDLLKHKGIEGVREQLVNDLYNGLYKDEHVRRRNIEVVAKNLTNLSRVKDGGNSHFLTGDYVPTTELLKHNEMVKDPEHKIKYTPVLKGAQFGSEFKSEDLLDRLNFQRLQQHLMHAAQTGVGWKIHGNNPIPNLAMGTISRTPGKSNY